MTVLDTLNFVAFNPLQNNNPIAVRRRKLIAKIDIQIQLATNKDYFNHSLCRSALFKSFFNLCFDLRITQVPQHYQSTHHSHQCNAV